jgi:hypothetical protein
MGPRFSLPLDGGGRGVGVQPHERFVLADNRTVAPNGIGTT